MFQYQVSFGQAVSMAFSNYINFNGRSSRSEFWWFYLLTFIIGIALYLIGSQWLSGVVNLALLLPSITVGVRRLHDIGKTGWLLFLSLIPIVNFILIYWFVQPSQPMDNQYGPVPNVA